MSKTEEVFKPIRHSPPIDIASKNKFSLRLLLDFQVLTLHRDLKEFMKNKKGKLLDIGCGDSPYEYMLSQDCEYIGIDIENQSDFDYKNNKISYFNGSDIPLENESVNYFICTEVIEHVIDPKKLISEMKRVLTADGYGLISIPWSARYHYIPHDFHRYTPAALKILFNNFKKVQIKPRGSDITVICSKIMVSIMGAYRNCTGIKIIFIPIIAIITIPVILLCVTVGHLSIILYLGSKNDPLGYTIYVSK